MARHRFSDALATARRADVLEPGIASYRALIGEITMEIGDYDRAHVIFDSLRREKLSDVAALRLARWDEISGTIACLARPLASLRGVVDGAKASRSASAPSRPTWSPPPSVS